MLLIKPEWLFDIGFQMSFAAVLSIVVFYKHLYQPEYIGLAEEVLPPTTMSFSKKERSIMVIKNGTTNCIKKLLRWIYGITVVSITAQVAVAPIIAWYFGTFSPWFLLSNYIVSPCALLIIPLAILTLTLGCALPYLPFLEWPLSICVILLQHTIHFLNSSMQWIATLPGN